MVPALTIRTLRMPGVWGAVAPPPSVPRSPHDAMHDYAVVVSAALGGTPSVDDLEGQMTMRDFVRLTEQMRDLYRLSGLIGDEQSGEAPAVGGSQAASGTGTTS